MEESYVYVCEMPGRDLDGEDTVIRATSRDDADARAAVRAKAWSCTLRFIGMRVAGKFVAHVPPHELPEWAREVA